MSIETECPSCGAEYDIRHGRCPVCPADPNIAWPPSKRGTCHDCGEPFRLMIEPYRVGYFAVAGAPGTKPVLVCHGCYTTRRDEQKRNGRISEVTE